MIFLLTKWAKLTIYAYQCYQNMQTITDYEDLGKLGLKVGTSKNDTIRVSHHKQSCINLHPGEIEGMYDSFGITYRCLQCQERWVVCYICDSGKLMTRKAVYDHKSKKHRKRARHDSNDGGFPLDDNVYPVETNADVPTIVQTNADVAMAETHNTTEVTQPSESVYNNKSPTVIEQTTPPDSRVFSSEREIPFQAIQNDSTLGFTCKRNIQFFQFCHTRSHDTGLMKAGIEYLTTRCLLNASWEKEEMRNLDPIPNEFQQLLLEYALLCFRSGSRNREIMCGLAEKLHTSGMQDGWYSANQNVNAKFNRLQPTFRQGTNYIKAEVAEPFTSEKCKVIGAHPFSYTIPTTTKQIRSMFMEGKNSIIQCLPHPEVKSDIKDHAYVSLEDCIRDALGFAACRIQVIDPFSQHYPDEMAWMFRDDNYDRSIQGPSSYNTSVFHPSRSRRAYELYQALVPEKSSNDPKSDETLPCYLYFWSDDCDTNSQVMKGRAMVWVKSMTIGSPDKNGNWLHNTYPVAIGTKKACHNEVEAKHADDLRNLQSPRLEPFYVGDINKTVRCRFGVMSNLGDQPEKRSNNWIGLGGALWAARSFISAHHFQLYDKLKACTSCRSVMDQRYQEGFIRHQLPECEQCLNWDALKPNSELAMVPVPKDYPHTAGGLTTPGHIERTQVREDGVLCIKPFEVTYEGLQTALKEAHSGFCDHGWTNENCKSFLAVECFNHAAVAKFLDHAIRAKSYGRIYDETFSELIAPLVQESLEALYVEDTFKHYHCRLTDAR